MSEIRPDIRAGPMDRSFMPSKVCADIGGASASSEEAPGLFWAGAVLHVRARASDAKVVERARGFMIFSGACDCACMVECVR